MSDRLSAAQAALNAGRRDEAIEQLIAAVTEQPARTVQVYRVLITHLHGAKRYAEGAEFAAKGLELYPQDFDLLNTYGVHLRRLKRYPEAVATLERALKVRPNDRGAANNLGNVLLDKGDGARAEKMFAKLARLDPRNPEFQRQLGRALLNQGKLEPALVRLRSAVALKRDFQDAWLDMAGALVERHQQADAIALLDKALEACPDSPRLLEARSVAIRQSGQIGEAEAYLQKLLETHADQAWLHYQLGTTISDRDRVRGNVHMRKAVELAPDNLDYIMALIESLERTRTGVEGDNIEEAYALSVKALERKAEFTPAHSKIVREVFQRVLDYERMEAVGDFVTLGRIWASTGRHTALLKQLAGVRSDADRAELLEQHRIWGRAAEKKAAASPIVRSRRTSPEGKIRLGFMSSDLRGHPVGYFALPLFDHMDRDRFEVFVYSYYQGYEDELQKHITKQVTAYRWWRDTTPREAAQRIADDQIDLLIELGGSTHMNKLDVMAYRPAARQASWLGYPHSAGLETIDYLVLDPYVKPERPELMIETPMLMPSSWIALGKLAFPDSHVIEASAPFERRGYITFGTANNTYKYTAEALESWARVVAAVPDSRFAFIRPEGLSVTFRNNVARLFAKAGVSRDRIEWVAVRGAHMQHYNKIDVALDTFPQTGGTTTCEALWMGVPTVSLVGPTIFERLSYSILTNAGLGDLCAHSVAEFEAKAVALAHDRDRIAALRGTLRDQLKASPLGRTEDFARDFYDMVATTLAAPEKRAAAVRA
ncbi:MAG: tetratricopeptide repeat protein [Phenylobacterium sp.]|uniref:O-linked N-acetylglucosamine transferase, SPINDLY family protein n=1 Tax=Phenylobacterium sp. TaxID=1871053 RepID=UPI0025D84E9E|nr:tetratricopeptide repeat protein [Phenylobacterium sp.]MBI1198259.1 tetratricopeptide repeat protein [Phenylobacterium sp.]